MSNIINFYEKIPKNMLNNAHNPNFELHHLKIPFRMVVCSPSGGGKSNFVLNLIHLFSSGREGTFKDIMIFTRNKDEPLYEYLVEKTNGKITVQEGIQNLPVLDKMDKKENHLIIFDDLVLMKNQERIEEYYIRARKLNCSVIYISQSFFKVSKIIRNNCNYMVILKLSGNREVNVILSEYGLGVSKEQLLKMYEYAVSEKFSPFLIDMEEAPEKRFRKGFLEIIDPNDYK